MLNSSARFALALFLLPVCMLTLLGCPPTADLDVDTRNILLHSANPSKTVTISNVGEGTLRWTANCNDPSISATPSSFTGNSKEVTISSNYFAEEYTSTMIFTNSDDTADTAAVSVKVLSDTPSILLPGGITLDLVWIGPGSFQMGRYSGEQDGNADEDIQHWVTISQGFWMGKYELTKAQWTAIMNTTPWAGQSFVLDDPNSPAIYVSWNDAQDYLTALNNYTGLTFCLPTEAEWEYACRAGTTTRYYWGDDLSDTDINDYAYWRGNAFLVGEGYAHITGQKLPNAWGLYDMSGNVWEWCQDWYSTSYAGDAVTDPAGPETGTQKVLRSSGWNFEANYGRSARRNNGSPDDAVSNYGFRVILLP